MAEMSFQGPDGSGVMMAYVHSRIQRVHVHAGETAAGSDQARVDVDSHPTLSHSPSYGLFLTPLKMASQCKRSSSCTGPRCSSASFGEVAYSRSSRTSRFVAAEDGGPLAGDIVVAGAVLVGDRSSEVVQETGTADWDRGRLGCQRQGRYKHKPRRKRECKCGHEA